MYSRQQSRDFRVPHNYSGNIFRDRPPIPTPVEDRTRRTPRVPPSDTEEQTEINQTALDESISEAFENEIEQAEEKKEKKVPILSPFGELGTEEILLIALALIIFQSGKEPDLALILLALLFIN